MELVCVVVLETSLKPVWNQSPSVWYQFHSVWNQSDTGLKQVSFCLKAAGHWSETSSILSETSLTLVWNQCQTLKWWRHDVLWMSEPCDMLLCMCECSGCARGRERVPLARRLAAHLHHIWPDLLPWHHQHRGLWLVQSYTPRPYMECEFYWDNETRIEGLLLVRLN